MKEAIRRRRMADQLARRGIRREDVLEALREVPRAAFVPEALRGKAYADAPLPIGEQQTISQPWIVGRMSELLEPDGSGRVLEVGTGSGYHAAVLSRLFDQVYTVERIPALAERARQALRSLGIENVHLKIFDGSYGWSEFSPYRAILVTASVPSVPEPLVDQLADEGVLVAPVGADPQGEQTLTRVRKPRPGETITPERHGACRFVPLVGRFGWTA